MQLPFVNTKQKSIGSKTYLFGMSG